MSVNPIFINVKAENIRQIEQKSLMHSDNHVY